MLSFDVYVQHPPVKIPGSARQVRTASGTYRTEWDWDANLELVGRGEAESAEAAWEEAHKHWRHPVLHFPSIQYRKPLEGDL